jgi:hypothetical protein
LELFSLATLSVDDLATAGDARSLSQDQGGHKVQNQSASLPSFNVDSSKQTKANKHDHRELISSFAYPRSRTLESTEIFAHIRSESTTFATTIGSKINRGLSASFDSFI